MGKNRIKKILGNIIGNLVVHKILVKHTNKPESINHLKSEIEDYRDNSLEIASEFNWNQKDKEEIRSKSLKNFKKDMKKNYKDVNFSMKEVYELIEGTMDELL